MSCDFFEARSLCNAPSATFLRRIHSATPRKASLLLHSLTLSCNTTLCRLLVATLSFCCRLACFFLVFCLFFGVMLSHCCRSARASRGYTVGLLLCSSDTCRLQLSLLSILLSVTATQGYSWGSLLQLDFVVVQFSKPLEDSCHVLQWVF